MEPKGQTQESRAARIPKSQTEFTPSPAAHALCGLRQADGLAQLPFPQLKTGRVRQVPQLQEGQMSVASPQPISRADPSLGQTPRLPFQAQCPQAGTTTCRKKVMEPAPRVIARSPGPRQHEVWPTRGAQQMSVTSGRSRPSAQAAADALRRGSHGVMLAVCVSQQAQRARPSGPARCKPRCGII